MRQEQQEQRYLPDSILDVENYFSTRKRDEKQGKTTTKSQEAECLNKGEGELITKGEDLGDEREDLDTDQELLTIWTGSRTTTACNPRKNEEEAMGERPRSLSLEGDLEDLFWGQVEATETTTMSTGDNSITSGSQEARLKGNKGELHKQDSEQINMEGK